MLVGAILLTAVDAPSEKGFVIMYIVAQVSVICFPHVAQHVRLQHLSVHLFNVLTCCQHDKVASVFFEMGVVFAHPQFFLVQSILRYSPYGL